MPKIIFQPLMISNPALKNVLTFLCSADLQSAAIKNAINNAINNKGCRGIINPPVLIGRTFFTADFKSAGTPSGVGTPSGFIA